MAQTQAEILDQIQSPKDSQTQSLQTTIDDPGIKGESSIEISNSSKSITLAKSTEKIGTSNMAGEVNGGMNNITNNYTYHLYFCVDASGAMEKLYKNKSGSINFVAKDVGVKGLSNGRLSEMEFRLQPNRDMNATDLIRIQLEEGTATAPESELQKELNNSCLASPNSKDEDEPTLPSAITHSKSIEMNPASDYSRKGPGNTVAEVPRKAYSPDKDRIAGGSLTHFHAMWNELAKMGPKKRSRVEVIFKQVVILAERLPKSKMIKISEYVLTCIGGDEIDEGVDFEESVSDDVISLTDFEELEKKLRLLDPIILNCDFHNILNIAKHRPHMLLEIMKCLNSFRDDV